MRVVPFAVVLLASAAAPAALAAEEMRPGPGLVIRDAGHDAKAFVPPLTSAAAPKVQTSSFLVTYVGFSDEARAAFEAAVDIASQLVSSPVPIRVEATWAPLDEDVLGNARANFIWRDFPGAPMPGVWYVDALADAVRGADLGGGGFDILATFNSDFGAWYFGTDGNTPFGLSDFMSVVLHELFHGLGFVGSASVDAGQGSGGINGFPVIYDLFTQDLVGGGIFDIVTYPNPSTTLGDVLQSDNVYWGGPLGMGANAGSRPRLYAPFPWEVGSSYSHLNESSFPPGNPNSLMTPMIARAEAIHDPGPITLCLFEDMGWITAAECGAGVQSEYWVATAANASGSQGSQWRSALGLRNRTGSTATVELLYHPSGGSTVAGMHTIPANGQLVIDDVVGFMGGAGTGPIEVRSDAPLDIASRTYNVSASGTFGQYLDGVAPGDALSAGETATLIMLQQNADFRSNIGFTNSGDGGATVSVALYDGSGTPVASFTVSVPPGTNRQENRPFLERGGRNDITSGYAVVTVSSGSGVQVYGSVIDNRSNDPTTIPAKR